MTKRLNPFVVSGKIPPEYFCDREKESAILEKALTNQLDVVLTSARRMGKTSLVDYVFDKPSISDDYVTVFVDILHTTTFREFILALGTAVFERVASRSDKLRRLFVTILKSLSTSFGYDPVQNTPTFNIRLGDINQPDYTLKEIFEYLEKVERRCLVVIDEFQQITRYPEKNVEALLRTHIQRLSNVNFVFSGSRRRLMEEIFFSSKRPFYQSARALRLEAIEKEKYYDFASRLFQQIGKKISTEAFNILYDTFWGVTFYIQRILKDAFAETIEGETCDTDMINNLIEDYIGENDSHLREQLAYITEIQKEVLYAIHEEWQARSISSASFTKKHSLRSPSSTQTAVLKLLEYDLITRRENVYSISDPLLSLWLDRR
ncbi:MAG: ATP-binding protein [Muribaculaceae bacterium]|nr:ATP-binding protein [Muribaculaceae bacterium]MBR5436961.1 ATP-binding protein [Muribaculaceae bacterium]MBR5745274.1 ATP-binding protein [Muribaculaceae bacterium]